MSAENSEGLVFDIQHFSLHDGPGVRSTIFLKGCPLSCRWCGNPESQNAIPQLLFFSHLCVGCGACAAICPKGAATIKNGSLILERDACDACGECVSHCRSGARSVSGKTMRVEEVCGQARRHWRIFQQSGGGVTVSGGEPLAQAGFLYNLLRELHDEAGLHTCLETSGKAPWHTMERMLPHLDMIFLDIKHMNGQAHRRGTGADNKGILSNARKLAKSAVEVVIRVPLMPGFNDDKGNLQSLAVFMRETGLNAVEIMPYHKLGVSKYEALGKVCAFMPKVAPDISGSVNILSKFGLQVVVHKH